MCVWVCNHCQPELSWMANYDGWCMKPSWLCGSTSTPYEHEPVVFSCFFSFGEEYHHRCVLAVMSWGHGLSIWLLDWTPGRSWPSRRMALVLTWSKRQYQNLVGKLCPLLSTVIHSLKQHEIVMAYAPAKHIQASARLCRSGGPKLSQSAAYPRKFAEWVTEQHLATWSGLMLSLQGCYDDKVAVGDNRLTKNIDKHINSIWINIYIYSYGLPQMDLIEET